MSLLAFLIGVTDVLAKGGCRNATPDSYLVVPEVSTGLEQQLHGPLPSVRGASSDVSGAPSGIWRQRDDHGLSASFRALVGRTALSFAPQAG